LREVVLGIMGLGAASRDKTGGGRGAGGRPTGILVRDRTQEGLHSSLKTGDSERLPAFHFLNLLLVSCRKNYCGTRYYERGGRLCFGFGDNNIILRVWPGLKP
jgi:hypothetical protein